MSCNTFIPIMDLVREVEALLAANYIDKDDPRITGGVFTNPTIREGFLLDVQAREEFCRLVQECGIDAPFGKMWLSRPLAPGNTLVSYEDEGEVRVKWVTANKPPIGKAWMPAPTAPSTVLMSEATDDAGFDARWTPLAEALAGALYDTNSTIVPAAIGQVERPQSAKNSESLSPADFGAKGDGITDDTVAFTGLFANGGNIHIPNGTYMIDAVNIGKPKNGSTIWFDAKAVMKAIPNDAKYYAVIDLDGVEDVIIYDAQIIGDKYEHLPGAVGASQWGHGINLIGSKNIKIYNPKVSKCWGDGIYMRQVENVLIVDPVCDDNRRQGMSIISAKDLVVIRPILINTSGQSPAYGLDMEVNWAGENFENVKIYNPVFRNNGKDGSYPAGMSVSLERASIPEKPSLPTPPTLIDIEIFDPIFENNALILSTSTNTSGVIKIHNPVINTSERVALYLLEAISPDCSIELYNVVIKDAVAAEGATVYDNPVNIESLTKNIGSQNILIDGLSISSAKYPRTNAVRVIQSEGATAPLKNVIIKDLKVSKDYTSHLNLSNGAMAITPDPTFRVEFSKDSMKEPLAVNSNISGLLNRTRAKVISAAATYNEYLNADIPVSDVEFYFENGGTGVLTLRFGTAAVPVKNYIYGVSNYLEDGVVLPTKSSWVKLRKIAENAWEVLESGGDIRPSPKPPLVAVWDPDPIPTAGVVTTTVPITGLKAGAEVRVTPNIALRGLMMYAEATSAGVATVYLYNPTAGEVDLPSITLALTTPL